MNGERPIVEISGVTKSFPSDYRIDKALRGFGKRPARKVVLNDISLSVQRGEIFGLLGPNGAGKTTLLKMMATLLLPDCGTIRIAGSDVRADPMAVKRHIGLSMGEERSFYYRLTARANLTFFGVLVNLPRRRLAERVAEVAETVDLTHALDRPVKSFSTGMRQRLGVARALLADPDILIFDEPTRAVDPVHALALRSLIRDRLARQMHKTVLLSTNLLAEAWSTCDRVAIVSGGRIAACGTPAALAAQYADRRRYSVLFEHLESKLPDRLRALDGVLGVERQATPGGDTLLLEIDMRGRAFTDVLGTLAANGSVVRSVREVDDALFDAFKATLDEVKT